MKPSVSLSCFTIVCILMTRAAELALVGLQKLLLVDDYVCYPCKWEIPDGKEYGA